MRSSAVAADIPFAQTGSAGFMQNETAKGIATNAPSISPFIEKSCVGINGSKAGKSTVPARTADTAASVATGPARNQRIAAATNIGSAAWTNSTGVKIILSKNGNSTRRISVVALCVFRYSGRSRARTGPYSTVNPDLRTTSGHEIPGAPSWGTMIFRWLTIPARPVDCMRLTSSSVPNVPLPAAHQTLIPLVSSTRIYPSIPASADRRASKLSV